MSCQLCVYYKPLHVTVKYDHDRVTNVAKAGDKHSLLFIKLSVYWPDIETLRRWCILWRQKWFNCFV